MVPRPLPGPGEPLLPTFYAGKNIFITGGTGFMGKVLIERLLSTCPDVGRLHLLLRDKRGQPPHTRLAELKHSQVFDNVRAHNPQQLEKLQVVCGDVSLPQLGLNNEAIATVNEVSIVFHLAATIKFDEPLPVAVEQNVRPVQRLLDLCDQLPNIEAFVHVSTAYSNSDLNKIEERVYPPPKPLQQVYNFVDAAPEDILASITPQYIAPKPNTYTFTKALAENVVEEHGNRGYPVAILRPTIVISSMRHPFPGWIESLNGPSGIIVGVGKGILHVIIANSALRTDLLPVDIAIDTLIAVAWEIAVDRPPQVRVYNCSTCENPLTIHKFHRCLERDLIAYPLDKCLWYPLALSITNKILWNSTGYGNSYIQPRFAYNVLRLPVETVPLVATDLVCRLFGIKTKISLIQVNRRLKTFNYIYGYFNTREWHFVTDNAQKLNKRLTPQDSAIFNLDPHSIHWDIQLMNFIKGTRKYLLREKDEDLNRARMRIQKMFFVHYGTILFVITLIVRVALRNEHVKALIYKLYRFLTFLVHTSDAMVKCTADPDEPQLPRFYAGREVLITGATGFMGKVLVERLLSTCPGLARVHVLLRARRGQPPHSRLAQLKQSQVFDNIRARSPSQLDKLVAVPGDVTEPLLGLDASALAALKEVSVVFHNAATVRFSEPLRDAVSLNVLSALNVMDMCDQLPALEALVHVSTAYTNCERPHVEERVYDMPVELPELLALLDTLSAQQLEEMTPKLIHPKPNTYVFTKALAEVAVARRARRNYSVTIFRPSIVISSHRAPFPGWVDSFSGLAGVVVGAGQGVLRVFPFRGACRADLVPVDMVADNMIAAAWDGALHGRAEARVYYCGSQERPLTWARFRDLLHRAGLRQPLDGAVYRPFTLGVPNRHLHKVFQFVLQTMPLYLAGFVSAAFGMKQPIDFKMIAWRLCALADVGSVFACNEWTFECGNMRRLRERLRRTDGHLFHLDVRDIDWQEDIANFHGGARRFLLRQPDASLPRARAHMNRLRLLHYVLQLVTALLCLKLSVSLAKCLSWTSVPRIAYLWS